ncbi:MAG: IS1182 family transposase [Thermoplasmata archaeon]
MSDYISSLHRRQQILFPETLDDYVTDDNPVRFLDAFVDSLDLRALGFTHAEPNETGRPPYDPADLLKLYLYGYLNKVRSSRRLERECQRNVEVIWLLRKLAPDFKTIADFRKDNVGCIRPLFQALVEFCKGLHLLDRDTVAIDGSKFLAVNSKDRHFDPDKLRDKLKRIEEKVERYLRELDENDAKEEGELTFPSRVPNLKEKIAELQERQAKYRGYQERMARTGEAEISLTDPESRMMRCNDRLDLAYNGQIAVEATNKLIVAYDVTTDAADNHQLVPMARQAREALGVDHLRVIADRGYFDGEQVSRCAENGITPYVPEPERAKGMGDREGIAPEFYSDKFVYDPSSDTVLCPAGHRMILRSESIHRWPQRPEGMRIRRYATDRCRSCPHFMTRCTHNPRGRWIRRTEYANVVEALRARMNRPEGRAIFDLRKSTVEHPFGTMKRGFDQGYLLTKGLRKVTGELGLTMLAYNLRRVLGLVGTRGLMDQLGARARWTARAG